MSISLTSSAIAAPNIALVKYWGKRDDLLKLPLNDSISMTLDPGTLASRTTLTLSTALKRDVFVLNGQAGPDAHIAEAICLMRERLAPRYPAVRSPMLVLSSNNFPTSAGVASSASGFAALAQALAGALGITDRREISILARLGSGSASRSVFSGFSRWKAGSHKDGSDSYAVLLAPAAHWPELMDLVAITDASRKKVSSKTGMERTVQTSELFGRRLESLPGRLRRVQAAIRSRDFQALGLEIMKDSNSMHATMLETWPPVMYLNDASRAIIHAIHEYNDSAGEIRAAYTFDAGPNAHVIATRQDAKKIERLLRSISGVQNVLVSPIGEGAHPLSADEELVEETAERLRLRL